MAAQEFTPAFRDRWVRALRSGEYEQTRGRLRDATGFCCYGVACDLIDPDGWEGAGNWGFISHHNAVALPNQTVFRLAVALERLNLQGDNDKGKDFSYIADKLEAYKFPEAEVPA